MPQIPSRPFQAPSQLRQSQYVTHVCADCGAQVRPKRITPGSFAIEVVLWLLMLLPGLIYSVWRYSTSYEGCPMCGGRRCVVLRTPAARAVLERFNRNSAAAEQ